MTNTLIVIGVVFLVVGAALAGLRIMRLSFKNLVLGLSGAIVGLLIGALLSLPLGTLPAPYSSVFPIVTTVLITLIMIGAFVNQASVLSKILPFMRKLDDTTPSELTGSANAA